MTCGLVLVLPLTSTTPAYFYSTCSEIALTMTNHDTLGRLAETKKEARRFLFDVTKSFGPVLLERMTNP